MEFKMIYDDSNLLTIDIGLIEDKRLASLIAKRYIFYLWEEAENSEVFDTFNRAYVKEVMIPHLVEKKTKKKISASFVYSCLNESVDKLKSKIGNHMALNPDVGNKYHQMVKDLL
jgi:hypothetical protein